MESPSFKYILKSDISWGFYILISLTISFFVGHVEVYANAIVITDPVGFVWMVIWFAFVPAIVTYIVKRKAKES